MPAFTIVPLPRESCSDPLHVKVVVSLVWCRLCGVLPSSLPRLLCVPLSHHSRHVCVCDSLSIIEAADQAWLYLSIF